MKNYEELVGIGTNGTNGTNGTSPSFWDPVKSTKLSTAILHPIFKALPREKFHHLSTVELVRYQNKQKRKNKGNSWHNKTKTTSSSAE